MFDSRALLILREGLSTLANPDKRERHTIRAHHAAALRRVGVEVDDAAIDRLIPRAR